MTLTRHYAALDQHFKPQSEPEYAGLVVPNGNAEAPFHRWFHLKEGFSSLLLERVILDAGLTDDQAISVLDPFAGGGTTIVSALDDARVVAAHGVERNPFLHLVAHSKTTARLKRPRTLRAFASRVIEIARDPEAEMAPTPALSTFSNTSYFHPRVLRDLLRIRRAIDLVKGTTVERSIARVALAASVEPASALRRDGRALRYEPRKLRADVWDEFRIRMEWAADDIDGAARSTASANVALGDGRAPKASLPLQHADLILFSPPYPNNIDYTEVYKLEAWFLGLVDSQDAFKRQRLTTLRSHPSIQFPDDYPHSSNGHSPEMSDLLAPLLASIPAGRFCLARERLVRGYFEDMLQVLGAAYDLQKPGGRLAYVVANSLHGNSKARLLIAADTMIARIAESVGYRVDRFVVARRPTRRRHASPLLRESIVFLTRI